MIVELHVSIYNIDLGEKKIEFQFKSNLKLQFEYNNNNYYYSINLLLLTVIELSVEVVISMKFFYLIFLIECFICKCKKLR